MRYRFCKVNGDMSKARLLERTYDGLDGGIKKSIWQTHENLWDHYAPAHHMFDAGQSWWFDYDVRTDTPCIFVGLTGWLPFLDHFLRGVFRNTLTHITRKQRADGCLPFHSRAGYKSESSSEWELEKYNLDDYIDGHLIAVINFCEDILFTRDKAFARKILPRLRKAMTFAANRKFKNGLMHVGYGGAFIELWYSFAGYPSTTQIFYIRSLDLMAMVERFLGHIEEAEKWESHIAPVRKGLKRLLTGKGFFINAIDTKGKPHGNGRDYYEAIPNVVAAPLEVVAEAQAKKIVASIKKVPQLDKYCPIAVNYPVRTESFHPMVEGRGVGVHWNGGAWSGFGGFEVWTHFIARDYDKAARLIKQMMDIRDEFGLPNFIGGFGSNKGANPFNRQPSDHPILFQQGQSGNSLRGLLGVQPRHDGIELMPRIFPDIKEITFKKPIYYADTELYVSIKNGKHISSVSVNGERIKTFTRESVLLKADALPAGPCRVVVSY